MPDFAESASDALHRILDPDSIDYVFSQQKKKNGYFESGPLKRGRKDAQNCAKVNRLKHSSSMRIVINSTFKNVLFAFHLMSLKFLAITRPSKTLFQRSLTAIPRTINFISLRTESIHRRTRRIHEYVYNIHTHAHVIHYFFKGSIFLYVSIRQAYIPTHAIVVIVVSKK